MTGGRWTSPIEFAEHIPEFGRHDKGEITIADVLAHRAGVPTLPREAFDLDRALDREFWVRTLCDAKPFARPGRFLAYHAASGGYILGEIVHRVTGKDIRTVLAEGILDPLGFRWTNYGVAPQDVSRVALNYVTGSAHRAPALAAVHAGARAPLRRAGRGQQRRALPDRDRPVRERGHDRQRARALL